MFTHKFGHTMAKLASRSFIILQNYTKRFRNAAIFYNGWRSQGSKARRIKEPQPRNIKRAIAGPKWRFTVGEVDLQLQDMQRFTKIADSRVQSALDSAGKEENERTLLGSVHN